MKKWLIPCLMLMIVWAVPAQAKAKLTSIEFRNSMVILDDVEEQHIVPSYNLSLYMHKKKKKYMLGFTGWYNDGSIYWYDVDKATFEKAKRQLIKMEE